MIRKCHYREVCSRHGLTVLALETDANHVHVFVSAPPRFSPAAIANLLKSYTSRFLREEFVHLKEACGRDNLWTTSYQLLRRHRWSCGGRNHQALHLGVTREVTPGRSHPNP